MMRSDNLNVEYQSHVRDVWRILFLTQNRFGCRLCFYDGMADNSALSSRIQGVRVILNMSPSDDFANSSIIDLMTPSFFEARVPRILFKTFGFRLMSSIRSPLVNSIAIPS